MARVARPTSYPRFLDEVTVRLVAGEVLALSVVAAATGWLWLYAPLAVDFAIRASLGPKVSPLALVAGRVVRPRVPARPRLTPAPPKRFAATLGAVFSVLVVLAWLLGWAPVAWAVVAVMIVFPALESLAGVCVGCHVFALLMRLGVVPESVCLECADLSLRQRRTSPAS